ncbi:MAG: hypothetical protein KGL12_12450 [Rhodospirillales bacterium]|nr:hypothetical protein [Rhodospirillales bacterium]
MPPNALPPITPAGNPSALTPRPPPSPGAAPPLGAPLPTATTAPTASHAAPAPADTPAPVPNPSVLLDPTLGLVVIAFHNAAGTVTRTIPSERQIAAYQQWNRDHSGPAPPAIAADGAEGVGAAPAADTGGAMAEGGQDGGRQDGAGNGAGSGDGAGRQPMGGMQDAGPHAAALPAPGGSGPAPPRGRG